MEMLIWQSVILLVSTICCQASQSPLSIVSTVVTSSMTQNSPQPSPSTTSFSTVVTSSMTQNSPQSSPSMTSSSQTRSVLSSIISPSPTPVITTEAPPSKEDDELPVLLIILIVSAIILGIAVFCFIRMLLKIYKPEETNVSIRRSSFKGSYSVSQIFNQKQAEKRDDQDSIKNIYDNDPEISITSPQAVQENFAFSSENENTNKVGVKNETIELKDKQDHNANGIYEEVWVNGESKGEKDANEAPVIENETLKNESKDLKSDGVNDADNEIVDTNKTS